MTTGLGLLVLEFIQSTITQWHVASPVDLRGALLVSSTIEHGPSGEIHLRLAFTAPLQPRHMIEGAVAQVGPSDLLVRVSPWPAVSADLYLGDLRFDYVHYVIDPGAALTGPPVVDGAVSPGEGIAVSTTTLKIGFLRGQPGHNPQYVHPAVGLRMMAFFDAGLSELLFALLRLNPAANGLFFLDAFVSLVDQAVTHTARNTSFLRFLLLREYEHVRDVSLPNLPGGLTRYESRLADILAGRLEIDYASLRQLIDNQSLFEPFIANSADRFALWYVRDMGLYLFVVEADRIAIDPVQLGQHTFTSLWNNTGNRAEIFDHQQYLAVFNGPFAAKPMLERSLTRPYPSEARIKNRSDPAVFDDLSAIRNPDTVVRYRSQRFHFLQRQVRNSAGVTTYPVEFGPGPLPDSTAAAPFMSGADDLPPVIHGGVRLSPSTAHPTVAWAEKIRPEEGLPMFGQATKHGKRYFFWLGRIHKKFVPLAGASFVATYTNMVDLLLTLGATDAVITDGADSTGLIVKGLGIVPGLEPFVTKDELVPIAIGFRKVVP